MYKTWFQRQKANSPYKGNAALIEGAGKVGASKSLMSGVQDSSIEKASENMQPTTGSVPNNNDTASTINASVCRSNWNPSIGDIRTSGTPVTIQCANALPSTSSINGWGESIICSNVPSR